MIDPKEISKQNLNDLVTIIVIQSEIIGSKELDAADLKRLDYCIKTMKEVTKKNDILNKS